MTARIIKKAIPSLKDACVRAQKYALAYEIRQLEKDIENEEGDSVFFNDKFAEICEKLDAVLKYKNSRVGESVKIDEETMLIVVPMFNDAEALRNQCAKLLSTAESMEKAAFKVITNKYPELNNTGFTFIKETETVVIISNK